MHHSPGEHVEHTVRALGPPSITAKEALIIALSRDLRAPNKHVKESSSETSRISGAELRVLYCALYAPLYNLLQSY
jgi:hypothetical protein